MRILAAEDDPQIGQLLDIALTHLGHQVTVVAEGQGALDAFRNSPFDAIVLDVMMPAVDGLTVLKAIREDAQRSEVPVVLLTAQTTEADHIKGFERGADAYVTKPFRPRELEALLTKLVSQSADERKRSRVQELDRAKLLRRLEGRF